MADVSGTNKSPIIWLEDPTKWEYLRETTLIRGSRRGFKPGAKLGLARFYKLVGYRFEGRICPGYFLFTIYWLKDYDRGCPRGYKVYDRGGFPTEARLVKDLLREEGESSAKKKPEERA
jgi:hypothetical protein